MFVLVILPFLKWLREEDQNPARVYLFGVGGTKLKGRQTFLCQQVLEKRIPATSLQTNSALRPL